MSAYEALAGCYDSLTQDIPYEHMLQYMEALLQRHGVSPQTVLDLACGTGSMSVILAQKGYRVIGVDMSEEMLCVAAQKAQKLDNPPFFACQLLQELKLRNWKRTSLILSASLWSACGCRTRWTGWCAVWTASIMSRIRRSAVRP